MERLIEVPDGVQRYNCIRLADFLENFPIDGREFFCSYMSSVPYFLATHPDSPFPEFHDLKQEYCNDKFLDHLDRVFCDSVFAFYDIGCSNINIVIDRLHSIARYPAPKPTILRRIGRWLEGVFGCDP